MQASITCHAQSSQRSSLCHCHPCYGLSGAKGIPRLRQAFPTKDKCPTIAHPALLDDPWSAVGQRLSPTRRYQFSKHRSSGQQCCWRMTGSLSISRSVLPPSAAARAGMHHRGCALGRVVLGYWDGSIDVSSLPVRVLHHALRCCRPLHREMSQCMSSLRFHATRAFAKSLMPEHKGCGVKKRCSHPARTDAPCINQGLIA